MENPFLQPACNSFKRFGTGLCRALHVSSFPHVPSIHNSTYDCTWVPRLLKIFLLGTRVRYNSRDVTVPEMVAIRQKAREAARGNLTCQPPDFPSRAMLGAFPGFVNWREVMFP